MHRRHPRDPLPPRPSEPPLPPPPAGGSGISDNSGLTEAQEIRIRAAEIVYQNFHRPDRELLTEASRLARFIETGNVT